MVPILPYILDQLKALNLKHVVHSFPSGAIMVDFWIDQSFYVIQIEDELIGISEVTEETTPFDIVPDSAFKSPDDFKMAFEEILRGVADRKIVIIHGERFSSLKGFYNEVDRVLTKNLGWSTGRNLNAFNDLLRGGFGIHEYEEPITLIWENSNKSKRKLNKAQGGTAVYDILVDIIRRHPHIRFIER